VNQKNKQMYGRINTLIFFGKDRFWLPISADPVRLWLSHGTIQRTITLKCLSISAEEPIWGIEKAAVLRKRRVYEKDLWDRWVLTRRERVRWWRMVRIDRKGDVTCVRRGEWEVEVLGWGRPKEARSWFQRQSKTYRKRRSCTCNEDDVDWLVDKQGW